MATKLFRKLPKLVSYRSLNFCHHERHGLLKRPSQLLPQFQVGAGNRHGSTYPVDDIIFGLTEEQIQVKN